MSEVAKDRTSIYVITRITCSAVFCIFLLTGMAVNDLNPSEIENLAMAELIQSAQFPCEVVTSIRGPATRDVGIVYNVECDGVVRYIVVESPTGSTFVVSDY